MKKTKSLLIMASALILASCGGLGNKGSSKPSNNDSNYCGGDFESVKSVKDSKEALATIQCIANELFGSAVEGQDYEYDAEYDMYCTDAIWENVKPVKALEEAGDYLPSCYVIDPNVSEDEKYFEIIGIEFWFEYYISPTSPLNVGLSALYDENGNVEVEFDVYIPSDDPIDDSSEPSENPSYGDSQCVNVIQTISDNLFDSHVEGEDYEWDDEYGCYYTVSIFDDMTPAEAIEEAPSFLPAGSKIDPDYEGGEDEGIYFVYYLSSNGEVSIDIMAYEDEEYGTLVEYDVYLTSTIIDVPGDDPVVPGDSDGDETYGNKLCIDAIETICMNLFGSKVENVDYAYDADEDIYWTFSEWEGRSATAIKEAAEYLPTGAKLDPEYPPENEGSTYGAYYLTADGKVCIDIYSYVGDSGTEVEFDVYLASSLLDDEPDVPGGTTDTGETSDGTKFASLSFEGYTSGDSAVFDSSITAGVVTFSASVGANSSGNKPTYYKTSDSLRLYWGNTLNISVSSGYYITKVEVTRTSDAPSDKILELDKMVPSTGSWSASNGIGTLTVSGVNTSSLSFSVDATKGHVRIESVTVYYAAK